LDLELSESERQLQADARSWLARTLPDLPRRPPIDDWPGRRRFDADWQRRLFDAGFAGLNWPPEWGGRGATPVEHLVFLEEMTRASAPAMGVLTQALLHAGPTIIEEGSPELKKEHLPRILRGDETWCQGFSEPGAGSDLASLRTRAVRDGDEYILNGQKIWTTYANVADYCEMLVRTDFDVDRKHKGITWLIVPMDTPGLTVRPIRTIVGVEEFAEVFLDDVHVPMSNRVGDEGDGWRVTMVTLSFERGTVFVQELIEGIRLVRELSKLNDLLNRDAPAWRTDGVRHELGWCAAQLDGLWALNKRGVTQASTSDQVDPRGGTVLKLRLTEVWAKLADLGLRILGRNALSLDDVGSLRTGHYVEERLRAMSFALGGGTSEIQRNIIGERVLGLPKEPSSNASFNP
jgi:alkylation response protein AidB-like acyl-CoA dehydrogenase